MKVRDGNVKKIWKEEILQMQNLSRRLFEGKKPQSLYGSCSYVMGTQGKHIRPLLFLFSVKILGGRLRHTYDLGLAVEMLHRASLIFDDIMDNSDVRHGKKALHKKMGMNNALLTGLSLLPISYDALVRYSPPGKVAGVINIINKALLDMNEGQALDVDERPFSTAKEYDSMIYKKTASFIEAVCLLAAYICDASERETKALAEYGKYMGMGFQIRDDLYDLLGKEKSLGKPIGGDINENKKTFLRVVFLEKDKNNKSQLLKLEKEKNKKGLSQTDLISSYVKVYTEAGAIDEAKVRIRSYAKLASDCLSIFPNSRYREAMVSIAGYLTMDL